MKFVKTILFFTFLAFIQSSFSEEVLTLSARKKIYDNYHELTKDKDCSEIDDFSSGFLHRGAVELVLFCQALRISGLDVRIDLEGYPNYARSLEEARIGRVNSTAETLWTEDVDKDIFYMSEPILGTGDIFFGLFTLEHRKDVLEMRTLKEIQTLSTSVQGTWIKDVEVLKEIGVKLSYVSKQDQSFQQLKKGRIDFVMIGFDDNQIQGIRHLFGLNVVPIPNVRVQLKGDRHFVLSKSTKNGEKIFEALQRGIGLLRKEGRIREAYIQFGYISTKTKDWEILNK